MKPPRSKLRGITPCKGLNGDLVEKFGFDPAALRAKSRDERDKWLREDGNEQCQEVTED